eukprot:GHVU01225018.1.p1 GENE.GHVU01225018.1~~GHVU01225018.1.p1  ORF type:complete len:111 (-),score=5.09 GHVU01225018.1:424-756(-)
MYYMDVVQSEKICFWSCDKLLFYKLSENKTTFFGAWRQQFFYFANTCIRNEAGNESLLVKQTIFFPASSKQSIFFRKNWKQTIFFGKNWKQTIFFENKHSPPSDIKWTAP